jgi:hypothetical protein
MRTCDGCGKVLSPVGDFGYTVCMECTKARARTVGNRGRCTCPKKLKRPRAVTNRIRAWEACDRCLGTIRALPDPGTPAWANSLLDALKKERRA